MHHLPLLHQLIGNAAGQVDRNGEAKTRTGAGAHQGVDADDLTIGIDQWSTGVTGVDGSVGLDQLQSLVREAQAVDVAVQAADDAEGDGAFQPEGSAQGDRPVPHIHQLGIPQRSLGRQLPAFELHERQIRDRIDAHHLTIQLIAIGQGDAHRLHPIHHVGVGQNQSIGINHHA